MARWFGTIGYAVTEEVRPGIWTDDIVERQYYGDAYKLSANWSRSPLGVNDDLTVSTQVSIIADAFALENFSAIKYVEFMGTKWKATSVDPNERPRIVITLGGEYHDD